jgi:hypothetical protein
MKYYVLSAIAVLLIAASMAIISGCGEYEVTQSGWWDENKTNTATPVITEIQPSAATPGVNTITIVGENFAVLPDSNDVYFDNTIIEQIEASSTSITVRRPNLVNDSCAIKVVSRDKLYTAKYNQLYEIDPVIESYGNFIENMLLSSIAIDSADNIYVTKGSAPRTIYRVTAAGVKDTLGEARGDVTDAVIGPDGRLYLLTTWRDIQVVDPATKVIATWVTVTGKNMKFGDFDNYGYFYAAGVRTDLVIIAPDLSNRLSGVYLTWEILTVHEHNGYLYIAAKPPAGQAVAIGIWRHAIGAGGTLGAQELVFNYGTTPYAARTLRAIAFAADGSMFIATDATTAMLDPILVVDPSMSQIDYFYKGIVPSYCRDLCWGNGTYTYITRGNTALQEDWTVYRLDMGITGD